MNILKNILLRGYLYLGLLGLTACYSQTSRYTLQKAALPIDTSQPTSAAVEVKYPQDTLLTVEIGGHLVDILYPPTSLIKGNILVLPGWSFPRNDWCQKSSLCSKATQEGYCLIFPEMGKSVYSSKYYPETRKEWQIYPTQAWLNETMIPQLQQAYNLLKNDQKNYLLGLSTGGRGVALVALANPDLFKAGAALSGDFDQTQMPQDRLMIGYYGTLEQFPERWKGKDNPQTQIAQFRTPLYLGHGKLDKVVPPDQTLQFYEGLRKAQPKLRLELHMPAAGHDYAYWDSETEAVLRFFEEF